MIDNQYSKLERQIKLHRQRIDDILELIQRGDLSEQHKHIGYAEIRALDKAIARLRVRRAVAKFSA